MSTVPEVSAPRKGLETLCEELYGISATAAAREAWATAVHTVAAKAQEVLPAASGERIAKAVAIVLSDGVELLPDGTAKVASQKTGTYHIANGVCNCADFSRAPATWCKHRISRALVLRAMRLVEQGPVVAAEAVKVEAADIPAHFIVELHGRSFVMYAGLLALAHQRGLVSLSARFISVTPECALAEATAVFADGRTFTEAADSTPQNVGAKVKAHYARMALTRAKARCLRDALNVAMCSLEEIE